jgi:outer membrane protein TolC
MILKDAIARRSVLGGALVAALAGCAAGPDFRSPAAPVVEGYRKDPLPAATVETKAPTGDAQRFVSGAEVPAQWWTAFANEELNRRIAQALAHSPSVASAQAALRQGQENANAARGSLFPSVDANVGVSRENANAA